MASRFRRRRRRHRFCFRNILVKRSRLLNNDFYPLAKNFVGRVDMRHIKNVKILLIFLFCIAKIDNIKTAQQILMSFHKNRKRCGKTCNKPKETLF